MSLKSPLEFFALTVPIGAALLLLAAIVLYTRFIEPNRLVVRRVRIVSKHGLNRREPLRITLLSDFHYPRSTSFQMVRRAIEKSNEFDPDVVFLLGDFFDKNRRDPFVLPDNIGAVFGGIHNRSGVFGVLGNHDHWFDERAICDVLARETDIELIDNQSVRIDSPGTPLYIAGVGDLWAGSVEYEKAVANVPEDAAILLLSHNPDVVEAINDPRILIQFSGHTHGGQIRLPLLGALKVPSKFGNKYARGLVTRGNHLLYVNSGICSLKKIRFLCPPEVTWVEIT